MIRGAGFAARNVYGSEAGTSRRGKPGAGQRR